jgi:hypothetical protein
VVNAVYANRVTNEFAVAGEELATRTALQALVELSQDPEIRAYLRRTR